MQQFWSNKWEGRLAFRTVPELLVGWTIIIDFSQSVTDVQVTPVSDTSNSNTITLELILFRESAVETCRRKRCRKGGFEEKSSNKELQD